MLIELVGIEDPCAKIMAMGFAKEISSDSFVELSSRVLY